MTYLTLKRIAQAMISVEALGWFLIIMSNVLSWAGSPTPASIYFVGGILVLIVLHSTDRIVEKLDVSNK